MQPCTITKQAKGAELVFLTTPAACRLLTADMGQLTARLMTMRLAAENISVNVAKIVEDHPSLLLQQSFSLDQQVRSCLTGSPDYPVWAIP